MTVKQISDTFEEYSLYLFAFFCCFPQKISSIFFVTWGSCWIINTLITLITQRKLTITWTREKIPAVLLLSLSVLALISVIYAADSSLALKRIFGQRLSILLVPIAILIGCQKINLKTFIYAFIYGNLAFILVSFIHVAIVYWKVTEIRLYINFLYYCSDVFHDLIHRSYSNLNIILGFIGLIFLWSKGSNKFLIITSVLYTISSLLFLIVNNSRGETIAFGFLILYFIIRIFFKSKKAAIYMGASIIAIVTITVLFFPDNRTIQTIKNFNTENNDIKENPRIHIWESAKVLIPEHPIIGYGTNNFEEPLKELFVQSGFIDGSFYEYNTHNQYIGFQLEYGIIGLVLFLVLLCSLFLFAPRDERKYLFIPITIIWIISFLFESFLDRYNGCATFSMTLLLLSLSRKEENPIRLKNTNVLSYPISILTGLAICFFLSAYISSLHQEGSHHINTQLFNDDFQGEKAFHFNPTGPNTFVLNHEIHGYTPFAIANLTSDQTGYLEVETYVTEEFNGRAFCITSELEDGSCPILCIYDLNQKEKWQKFQVQLTKGLQTILCFEIHSPAVYKEKSGTVYLKNPRINIKEGVSQTHP